MRCPTCHREQQGADEPYSDTGCVVVEYHIVAGVRYVKQIHGNEEGELLCCPAAIHACLAALGCPRGHDKSIYEALFVDAMPVTTALAHSSGG